MKGSKLGKISYHPEIAFRIIDGEAVVITPKDGVMHTLNHVGTALWKMLEKKPTRNDLVDSLVEAYEVTPAAARKDVDGFVAELMSKGLVLVE
ncbi:MAG: PqqD family protein [Nitrospirae bacterium]|nr:PqqD family protein [Nitrospirota bacterium]